MTSDEKLIATLLMFAAEDYYEDWSSSEFVETVKAACRRLDIPYFTRGGGILESIEKRLEKADGR